MDSNSNDKDKEKEKSSSNDKESDEEKKEKERKAKIRKEIKNLEELRLEYDYTHDEIQDKCIGNLQLISRSSYNSEEYQWTISGYGDSSFGDTEEEKQEIIAITNDVYEKLLPLSINGVKIMPFFSDVSNLVMKAPPYNNDINKMWASDAFNLSLQQAYSNYWDLFINGAITIEYIINHLQQQQQKKQKKFKKLEESKKSSNKTSLEDFKQELISLTDSIDNLDETLENLQDLENKYSELRGRINRLGFFRDLSGEWNNLASLKLRFEKEVYKELTKSGKEEIEDKEKNKQKNKEKEKEKEKEKRDGNKDNDKM